MFVSKEKLVDAEERILRSFQVQDNLIPFPELLMQLARRQIESMVEGFAERKLIGSDQKEQLVQRSYKYLDAALGKDSNSKMSYRGRAAAVMLNAARDLGLHISETDIARAAGLDKKPMTTNSNAIAAHTQAQR